MQGLLERVLLLDADIDEILSFLPSTLNETYDNILLRVSQFPQTHQDLVKIALRWIAVAQQPLLVEELIEACTVKLEGGGQVREDLWLSPAQIALLLRHLVVLEKDPNETATELTSTAACNKDSVVFAHFSVKEYLTDPEKMAPDIRSKFGVDLKQAHSEVASSCIAYLLRTNTLEERKTAHPLREYAWDLWALHTCSSTMDTSVEASNQAQDLYEKVAFLAAIPGFPSLCNRSYGGQVQGGPCLIVSVILTFSRNMPSADCTACTSRQISVHLMSTDHWMPLSMRFDS